MPDTLSLDYREEKIATAVTSSTATGRPKAARWDAVVTGITNVETIPRLACIQFVLVDVTVRNVRIPVAIVRPVCLYVSPDLENASRVALMDGPEMSVIPVLLKVPWTAYTSDATKMACSELCLNSLVNSLKCMWKPVCKSAEPIVTLSPVYRAVNSVIVDIRMTDMAWRINVTFHARVTQNRAVEAPGPTVFTPRALLECTEINVSINVANAKSPFVVLIPETACMVVKTAGPGTSVPKKNHNLLTTIVT
jgi:hypothetical protein